MQTPPSALVPESDGGLGYDVRVQPAIDRYDAKTILRMVKLVNRRGRVRLFSEYDGAFYLYTPNPAPIAGLDERQEFVAELLDDGEGDLLVSFEDRHEAKRFASDLNGLRIELLAAEQMLQERERRRALVEQHTATGLPARLDYPAPEGWVSIDVRWINFVAPERLDVGQLDAWTRKHLEGKYLLATWKPGEEAIPARIPSKRVWRASATDWRTLIDRCRETGCYLLIHFYNGADRPVFDRHYGPGRFLHR